jgi:hypothetical protein
MATCKEVLIPLPDRDFDTTEVSIPWKTDEAFASPPPQDGSTAKVRNFF